ncbi:MAG: F0F1 ATP synthase subunit A [Candidatus Nomurabacteria bacterium]|jgi:F-type H+-transporting ATPase subunit a|nr:F0F1 ATP synthase subunit A [Candidatus Nomurabacteria bacterium]
MNLAGGFAAALNVSVSAEPIFSLGKFTMTNSMLLGIGGWLLTLIWLLYVGRRASDDSKKKGFFTRLVIWCFTGLYCSIKEIVPNKKVQKVLAPLAISLFFYIALQYYVELLPFVGQAITLNGTPLLRGPDSDLNLTFGLAILVMVMVQVFAVVVRGFRGNLKRYFVNPFKNPIGCFAGILELIAEFSRLIALAMRLFGNVFAGEVLILIGAVLGSYASPFLLPFLYIFELFIGGIQAYVFFMLCVVFTGLAVQTGDESDHSTSDNLIAESATS